MKADEGCPQCQTNPLVVEWVSGTLDFYCAMCLTPLSPDATTLIKLLPGTEGHKWWE